MPGPYARNASWVSSHPACISCGLRPWISWQEGWCGRCVPTSGQNDHQNVWMPLFDAKWATLFHWSSQTSYRPGLLWPPGALSFCFHATQGWRSSSFKGTQWILWVWSTWQTRRGMVAWIAPALSFLPSAGFGKPGWKRWEHSLLLRWMLMMPITIFKSFFNNTGLSPTLQIHHDHHHLNKPNI